MLTKKILSFCFTVIRITTITPSSSLEPFLFSGHFWSDSVKMRVPKCVSDSLMDHLRQKIPLKKVLSYIVGPKNMKNRTNCPTFMSHCLGY